MCHFYSWFIDCCANLKHQQLTNEQNDFVIILSQNRNNETYSTIANIII